MASHRAARLADWSHRRSPPSPSASRAVRRAPRRFAGLDWEALFVKSMAAPINPEVKGKDDTSNFDKYPDSTEDQRVKIDPRDQALFKDF
jgi:hypothetical protein